MASVVSELTPLPVWKLVGTRGPHCRTSAKSDPSRTCGCYDRSRPVLTRLIRCYLVVTDGITEADVIA